MPSHPQAVDSSTTSTSTSLKAHLTAPISRFLGKLPQRDIYPDLEVKIETSSTSQAGFALQDGLAFMMFAAQAIAQDEFSKCFVQKPRTSLLKTISLGRYYILDFLLRYLILFPYRFLLLLTATLAFFIVLPLIVYSRSISWQRWLFRTYCKAYLASWGSKIRYHGVKPELAEPHVFVANHTSFIDFLILSADKFPHAAISQRHGGIMGYFQRSILTLNGSLMFNRNQKDDRTWLAKKMKEHVFDTSKSPMLIFPEGTCVNNEYTVLFHKGAFEMQTIVCPVAIKYDKTFADAYWHSRTQTFTKHLLYLMSCHALVADVWYLPPRAIRPGQTPIEFANEVKSEISKRANLRNLSMDGYFKNFAPAEEKRERLRENPQTRYGAVLANRMKNRLLPDRHGTGHRRHFSEFSLEQSKPNYNNANAHLLHQIDVFKGIIGAEEMDVRNRILVALEDEEHASNMIKTIADRKNNVVETWKKFSKMRAMDDHAQRRVENSSWRLWFKQRIEQERLKEQQKLELELQKEFDEEDLGIQGAIYSLFSSRTASLSDLRRIQSTGSLNKES